MTTVNELTRSYIRKRPSLKDCLAKGLINYSALSRLIKSELKDKKVTKAAILIAARRFRDELGSEEFTEEQIMELLKNAEIEIKNKVFAMVVDKSLNERILELEREIKSENGLFYLIEGSSTITIISSERYFSRIKSLLRRNLISSSQNLVMIIVKSSPQIEKLSGVVSFIYSLFADQGINLVETMSCWTDTMVVIEEKDLPLAMQILKF
ncbi:ACT domain-containing protein [Candidatus Woesearchaeota archaeon]|nr:ACT domain-containing protein [Candidatus Woesearchaeota archaeon]